MTEEGNKSDRMGVWTTVGSVVALVFFLASVASNDETIQRTRVVILIVGPTLSIFSLVDSLWNVRRRDREPVSKWGLAFRVAAVLLWAYVAFAYLYRLFINPPQAP
jgi:UDP-N-acetylmuramyl pentapeptide phosphotransferase/UDP-N-acetylglucosamine-1-phosphate transferase